MTFGLVKGSSPTDNLYYGVSIQSSLPRLHLVWRSETAGKAIWPRETSLHHCSAHCSKMDRTFDGESRRSANHRYSHLSATRVTWSYVTNRWTNSHKNGRAVTGPIATAFFQYVDCALNHAYSLGNIANCIHGKISRSLALLRWLTLAARQQALTSFVV